MATGNQLMDEIYDQFLICKICYEIYRRPKTLTCLHTFCADCLEKHQDAEVERSYRYMVYSRAISCPICRKKTELPSGGVCRLPDNFLVENLSDVVNRRKPSAELRICEICKPASGARPHLAISKCLDCSKLLCKNCVDLHRRTKVTEAHSLVDTEVEKDIRCKVHVDEVVRFYCEPCEVCICVVCTFQEHKGHDVSSFPEGIAKYSHSLDSLLDSCRQRIANLKDQLHLIHKCEGEIKKNEQHIRDMAIDSIGAIRKKEKQMVKDLHALYGQSTLEFMKSKEPIQESIETLQSTHNLTDIILRDKSIELLLLRKEIQEKIECLLEAKPESIPDNILKEVRFVPGSFVFGYLDVGDADDEEVEKGPKCPEEELKRLLALQHVVHTTSDTQTEACVTAERATTMGKLVFSCDIDCPTQTDRVQCTDSSTLTMTVTSAVTVQTQSTHTMARPDVRDHQTMTLGPAVTRRKTQTERVTHADQMTWTTRVRTNNQCISTNDLASAVSQKSECTMTSPCVKDSETMTPQTPTMRRKMQTEPIRQTDQTTATTETEVDDKFTNTQVNTTCERSTLTTKRTHADQKIDTKGLYIMTDKETGTPVKRLKASATLTEQVSVVNRSTLTTQTTPSDKCVGTPVVLQYAQETNTPVIHSLDMGVTAKVPGTDAATGTRNIVLADTGTGEHGRVDTRDQGTDPCHEVMSNRRSSDKENKENIRTVGGEEKNVIHEKLKTKNKGIFTKFFSKVSKDNSEAEKPDTASSQSMSSEAGSPVPHLKMVSTYTDIQNDRFVMKVAMSDVHSQTNISLKENILPSEKETNTQHTATHDTGIVTDQLVLVDAGISHQPDNKAVSTSTDELTVSTQDISTATDLLSSKDNWHDAYRGTVCDSATNTELNVKPVVDMADGMSNTEPNVVVKALVNMADGMSNTEPNVVKPLVDMKDGMSNTEPNVVKPLVDMKDGMSNTTCLTVESKSTSMSVEMIDTCSDPIGPELTVVATNTDVKSFTDAGSSMKSFVRTSDTAAFTPHLEYQDCSCSTSMETQDCTTETEHISTAHSETMTDQVQTHCKQTGTPQLLTVERSMETLKVVSAERGNSPIHIPGQHKETSTPTVECVSTGVGCPQVLLTAKGTCTTRVETTNSGTCTYVQTVDKATYHPHPITIDTGVETMHTQTSNKKVNTLSVENTDAATMTSCRKLADKDTTMCSLVATTDTATATTHVSTADANTEAVYAHMSTVSTSTDTKTYTDTEVNTVRVGTSSSETTTNHRVDTSDAMEGTQIISCDVATGVDVGEPKDISTMTCLDTKEVGVLKRPHTVTRGTGTQRMKTCTKGTDAPKSSTKDNESMTEIKSFKDQSILSRPIDLTDSSTLTPQVTLQDAETSVVVQAESRGSSPIRQPLEDRGVSPVLTMCVDRESSPLCAPCQDQAVEVKPLVAECETLTTAVEVEHRGTATVRVDTQHRQCSPVRELNMKDTVDTFTCMAPILTETRHTSTVPVASAEKAMGTEHRECADRESSPVRFPGCDQGVMVSAEVRECGSNTSPSQVDDKQTSTSVATAHSATDMPQVHVAEKETSTTQVQMTEKETSTTQVNLVEKETSMPQVQFTEKETSTPQVQLTEKETNTPLVQLTEKETSTPLVQLTEKETSMPQVILTEKETSTPHIQLREKETSTPRVHLIEKETSMPQIHLTEKETSTPQVHLMHKFVATDNTCSVDKQTSTFDVTSEYRGLIDQVPAVTVCRGTCTTQVISISKHTSPPPPNTTEKASSPVRAITSDKAVMAKKGEILEPVDTYQSAGVRKRPMKPIFDSPRSSLEMIREETKDSSSEDDGKSKVPGMLKSHSLGNIPYHVEKVPSPKRFNHKEAFFVPSLPRLGKPSLGSLLLEKRISPSSILAKVEAATNTVHVSQATCGTSTPVVDKEDKAICTESVSVDGKMAECISKLKTVRQRLEQPQPPMYSTASSQAGSTPFITSSTSSATTVRPSPTLQAASRSVADRLSEAAAALHIRAAAMRRPGAAASSGSESNTSDQEQSSSQAAKARLARKQRLNISELLRSSSLPDNNPSGSAQTPLVRPKLQLKAVHRQVIPKLEELVYKEGPKEGKKHHQSKPKPPTQVDALVSPMVQRRSSSSHKSKHQTELSAKPRTGRHRERSGHAPLFRERELLSDDLLHGTPVEERAEPVRASRSLPPTPKLRSHKKLQVPLVLESSTSSSVSSGRVEDSESTDS